jgi:hypothetical protein
MALRQTAGHFTIIAAASLANRAPEKINRLLSSSEFDTVDRVTSNFYDF